MSRHGSLGEGKTGVRAPVQIELPVARLSYRSWGRGPVVLLLHGLAGSGEAWVPVAQRLAADHTVVVPDLPGHGSSFIRNGDHSLANTATSLRDLLAVLGHDRVTVLGHSLGGGVALHFAYQYPDRCQRLILVSPGGLGRQVHPALRAMSLPGSELVLAVWGVASALRRLLRPDPEAVGAFPRLRQPFLAALRTVVDWKGQRVDALEALAVISTSRPTLVVWGEEDPILPVSQAWAAARFAPRVQLITVPGSGHTPHLDDPDGFCLLVRQFLAKPLGIVPGPPLSAVLSERQAVPVVDVAAGRPAPELAPTIALAGA